MRIWTTGVTLAALGALAGLASADVIRSDFNAGAEDWLVADGDAPDHQSTSALPTFLDPSGSDGFITTPRPWITTAFFVAPGKFLGDQSDKFGGRLEMDRWWVEPHAMAEPYQIDYLADVTITGASMTLAADLAPLDTSRVDTYIVDLSEAGAWFHLDSGLAATDLEIAAVLGDLSDIRVRGNINDTYGEIGLDNFALVPTPGSVAVLGAAALMIRRRRS